MRLGQLDDVLHLASLGAEVPHEPAEPPERRVFARRVERGNPPREGFADEELARGITHLPLIQTHRAERQWAQLDRRSAEAAGPHRRQGKTPTSSAHFQRKRSAIFLRQERVAAVKDTLVFPHDAVSRFELDFDQRFADALGVAQVAEERLAQRHNFWSALFRHAVVVPVEKPLVALPPNHRLNAPVAAALVGHRSARQCLEQIRPFVAERGDEVIARDENRFATPGSVLHAAHQWPVRVGERGIESDLRPELTGALGLAAARADILRERARRTDQRKERVVGRAHVPDRARGLEMNDERAVPRLEDCGGRGLWICWIENDGAQHRGTSALGP